MTLKPSLYALAAMIGTMTTAIAEDYPEPNSAGWKKLFAVDPAEKAISDMPLVPGQTATSYRVTYKGEIAGFDVGRIFLDVKASDENYEVGYRMEQKGIARWFSDAEARARASGSIEDGQITGHYYFNHDYEGDDDYQYVEIFRAPGERRLHLWTDPTYTFFEPVSEDLAFGALDPMGALMNLGFLGESQGETPCDRTTKVFDGRRRFDLVMRYDGEQKIRRGGKGRFQGHAYKCKLEQEKVAGYREKDQGDIEGDLWVYLTEVPEEFRTETMQFVPVMIVAKRGILTARLEGKYPTLTAPDGRTHQLGY